LWRFGTVVVVAAGAVVVVDPVLRLVGAVVGEVLPVGSRTPA
jgi:hypothetical protein